MVGPRVDWGVCSQGVPLQVTGAGEGDAARPACKRLGPEGRVLTGVCVRRACLFR